MEYLQYDIVTLYQIIEEQESDFPTISICNLNRFKENALNESLFYCVFNADDSCLNKKEIYFELFHILVPQLPDQLMSLQAFQCGEIRGD